VVLFQLVENTISCERILHQGKYGEKGIHLFDRNKAHNEQSNYNVFNGYYNGLVHLISDKLGKTIRLLLGYERPNLICLFHEPYFILACFS